MSLDKAIQHQKEYRKPFYGFQRNRCHRHGSCSYCVDNRLFASKKNRFRVEVELEEWKAGKDDLAWEEYQNALDWDLETDIFGD
jgi:hypothetical protein